METSPGIPLTDPSLLRSGQPGWSRTKPFLRGSLPSSTQSATYLTAPLPSSPYREYTRTTRVTETFCSHRCKNTKPTSRNARTWSSGECNWWPVSHHKPLDTTPPPLGKLAKKKFFLFGQSYVTCLYLLLFNYNLIAVTCKIKINMSSLCISNLYICKILPENNFVFTFLA